MVDVVDVVERGGIPLAVRRSAANSLDSRRLEPALDASPPLRQPHGGRGSPRRRPRRRPHKLHADKGYDSPRWRAACRQRGILTRLSRLPRRGVESRERLGRHRWVVERTRAWLNRFRRRTVRYPL